MTRRPMTAAQELRLLVQNMNRCNESFLDQFTVDELIQLFRMQRESGWDFSPDQWMERQVREGLEGIAPQWNEHESPTYAKEEPIGESSRPILR